MKTRARVKAGGTTYQHNEMLRVRTGIKSGRIALNHLEKIASCRR